MFFLIQTEGDLQAPDARVRSTNVAVMQGADCISNRCIQEQDTWIVGDKGDVGKGGGVRRSIMQSPSVPGVAITTTAPPVYHHFLQHLKEEV